MNNNMDVNNQLNRMKALMGYGLNEGKKRSYNSVEYSKVAADGKLYGIVREGTKYYIKVSPSTKATLAESFEYIGGFRNRKDNEYTSFANAQKQFDLKMMSLNESCKNKVNVDSWNPEKNEYLTVESTNKMKKEINRERQIMQNVSLINEKKEQVLSLINEENAKDTDDMKGISTQSKNNFKKSSPKNGKPVGTNGDPFTEKAMKVEGKDCCPKCGKCGDECECDDKEKIEEASSEVLGWNRKSAEYMDKSHGTEIGDSAPFDDAVARNIDDGDKVVSKTGEMKNGVVEGNEMHNSQNQNKPTPGVGEIGDDQPFDGEKGRQIDEAIDDIEGDVDVEDPSGDDFDGEGDFDNEGDFGDEEDVDLGTEDDDLGTEDEDLGDDVENSEYNDDIESRLSALESKLDAIASAVGADTTEADFNEYTDDEPLYGDDDSKDDYDENFEDDDEGFEDDDEGFEDDDEEEVYESRNYRKLMLKEAGMKRFSDAGRVPSGNMNRLNDFGKHPAYQKKVMTLPPKDLQEFPDYYDMNDDSVKTDTPYGVHIGDGAPFEVDIQSIENAISESIMRYLKKKK